MSAADDDAWLTTRAASAIQSTDGALDARAVRWMHALRRLGVGCDPAVVRDVGALLAIGARERRVALHPRVDAIVMSADPRAVPAAKTAREYAAALASLASDPAIDALSALRLDDALVEALLATLLGAGIDGAPTAPRQPTDDAKIATLFVAASDGDLFARLADRHARALREWVDLRLRLDLLDVSTVRLLASSRRAIDPARVLGSDAALTSFASVDLVAAIAAPQAGDVARFSLELAPELDDSHRARAAGLLPIGGLSTISTQGSLDALVPSELAWDDDELARRAVEGELLRYARERTADRLDRRAIVLVDASASMRGGRATFARGLALALARRLERRGDDVSLRFFDRRLHPPIARGRGASLRAVPALLSFRGEIGRDPDRALAELVGELEATSGVSRPSTAVYVVSHAAFAVSAETSAALRRRARFRLLLIGSRDGSDARSDHDELGAEVTFVALDALGSRQERAAIARGLLRELDRDRTAP